MDAIATTSTGPGDRPADPVVIESVEIEPRVTSPAAPAAADAQDVRPTCYRHSDRET